MIQLEISEQATLAEAVYADFRLSSLTAPYGTERDTTA